MPIEVTPDGQVNVRASIVDQKIMLDVGVHDYAPALTSTTLHERGTRIFTYGCVYNARETIYIAPFEKTAFLTYVYYTARSYEATATNLCYITLKLGEDEHTLIYRYVKPGEIIHDKLLGVITRLRPGEEILVYSYGAILFCAIAHVIEV